MFAGSKEELIHALSQTVATSFSVYKGGIEVATGSLGSNETMLLPEGDYRVELHSAPPQIVPVTLSARDNVVVTLEKSGEHIAHREQRIRMEHKSCDDVVARIERLENRAAAVDRN